MTIKDIARLSGYSVATVSRALNSHPDISEAARAKILEVVAQQDFQPNNNAKHLKQQADTGVAIVVKGIMNLLFAELVERVQDLLQSAGQEASVHYLDEDANEVVYACHLCRERKPRFANLSSFTTDDAAAAAQVIGLLADKGHRSIGVLGGNFSCSQISFRRLTGCKEAFARLGIPFDEALQYEPCRYSMRDAYAATRRLLERSPGLTALFAVGDVIAMGAVRARRDLGRRVPDDLSVVGYDGVEMSRYTVPRLTTVRQDVTALAERGVDDLLRRIGWNRPPVHEVIPFRMIDGESVAGPAAEKGRGPEPSRP